MAAVLGLRKSGSICSMISALTSKKLRLFSMGMSACAGKHQAPQIAIVRTEMDSRSIGVDSWRDAG